MTAVTTDQMRRIDSYAIGKLSIPSLTLMENAARHTADAAEEMLCGSKKSALIVCGTGNNGGDGLACARLLHDRGIPVTVWLAGNPEKLTPDAAANARRLREIGITITPYTGQKIPDCGCIVDALFGFGLNREVGGIYLQAIEAINISPAPVVACDIPSGLSGDTGYPLGISVKAARTVTFTCPKIGLTLPHAAPYVGTLTVADIGIPQEALNIL